jgi:hypothetical protein
MQKDALRLRSEGKTLAGEVPCPELEIQFMRLTLATASFAFTLFVFHPQSALAQKREPVRITGMRVGYSLTAADSGLFKAGAWTPVYLDLEAGAQGADRGEVIVEASDSDDIRNRYITALPSMDPGEQTTIISYQRPAAGSSEIVASVRIDGKVVASQEGNVPGLDYDKQLLLAIGSRLNHLRRAIIPQGLKQEDAVLQDTGPRRVAVVGAVAQLPNNWFAYDGVDLIIMTTGNREFINALVNEREGRKQALVEWVRRGGKLVISTGRNQDVVAGMEAFQPALPVSIAGTLSPTQIFSVRTWKGANNPPLENPVPRESRDAKRPPIDVAKLLPKSNREAVTVLKEPDGTPIIVQGPYGLGRVTVVAFDLDEQPFKSWAGASRNDNFWEKLLEINSLPQPAADRQQSGFGGRAMYYDPSASRDLATNLVANLEEFEDVPVISFGWVALFILLYILVVGPLDYLFLKKVVKRLELTWITFPTVVIAISVVAYFTAYWLKGNDQKINKVDLLDIDLQTQQIYGRSWYTIFSPRIQNYTIGLEPTAAWTPGVSAAAAADMNMSWMARPEMAYMNRTGSQGLFRRAYDYAPLARALIDVPIQVWSTKSFQALWASGFASGRAPVASTLHHVSKASSLSGTVTSHLPTELVDVFLYYHPDRKWYPLDKLLPDLPRRIDAVQAGGQGLSSETWFGSIPQGAATMNAAYRPPGQIYSVIKRLLFAQLDSSVKNVSLAQLDQSWRLAHSDVAFVVGRIPRQDGSAEQMSRGSASPTTLWLGSLPGSGQPRPALSGTLRQDTYVRMILPVMPAE